jgi:hypothetical protein
MQAQNIIGGRSWPTLKKREAGATNAGRSRTSKHCTVENIHTVLGLQDLQRHGAAALAWTIT